MKSRYLLTTTLTIFCLTTFTLSICLWAGEPSPSASPQAAASVPAACQTDCATPYGQVLGTAPGNVPAYSNCNAKCVIFEPNKEKGTYTGIKWQCVEFARRWLLNQTGTVYGDVDTAADIWKLNTVTRISNSTPLPFDSYPNGATTVPQVGDLLIYAKEYLNTGHVAVITQVDKPSGVLKIAEQNFSNAKWSADYARTLPMVEKDGKYWVLDTYLLGWKHVSTVKH